MMSCEGSQSLFAVLSSGIDKHGLGVGGETQQDGCATASLKRFFSTLASLLFVCYRAPTVMIRPHLVFLKCCHKIRIMSMTNDPAFMYICVLECTCNFIYSFDFLACIWILNLSYSSALALVSPSGRSYNSITTFIFLMICSTFHSCFALYVKSWKHKKHKLCLHSWRNSPLDAWACLPQTDICIKCMFVQIHVYVSEQSDVLDSV